MNATLSRSDVLKPLAWLIGIMALCAVLMMMVKAPNWVLLTVLPALVAVIVLYCVSYVYCLFFDRDALRSEKYSLNKMAIEHGLLGDSTAGTFASNTILGEATHAARQAVDLPKIEKQE